jgi:flagellar biosynthesis component FlhA
MKREVKSKTEKREFTWWSLRIGFSIMILLLILSFFVNIWILNLFFLILLLFNIVISIVHLFKHKKKALAIIILVISALLALFYIIGISIASVA